MLELQKLFTSLAMPLGTALSLGLVALAATALARRRIAMAAGAAALVREIESRTTTENARASAPIPSSLGARRVFLVTSTMHMPRALVTFKLQGVEVIPAATDVEVVPKPFYLMRWLPAASALDGSSQAIHELLGLVRCRLIGC